MSSSLVHNKRAFCPPKNTPDKDIVENPNIYSPAYIVFRNYELILKWNRSLRFALAVCTLKDNIKNEL